MSCYNFFPILSSNNLLHYVKPYSGILWKKVVFLVFSWNFAILKNNFYQYANLPIISILQTDGHDTDINPDMDIDTDTDMDSNTDTDMG